MKLNGGRCEFCADGEYFDKTAAVCQTWAVDSCNELCSDQSSCFDCSGDWYDLETMSCVTACPTGTLELSGAEYHNLKFCRTLEYYVDSESTDVLELGTRAHPYKYLGLPLQEVFNHLSLNTDHTVKIFIKEGTKAM